MTTMHKLSHLAVAILLALALVTLAHSQGVPRAIFAGAPESVTIPLDIDNSIIRMKVRINGSSELTMVFDTGASMTGIDEHFVEELGLTTTSDTLRGSGTGGKFTGTYIKSSTLSVDGVQVTDQPLAAFKINTPPGFEFDGIIGYDFIKAFVVEIDYVGKTMTLSDPAHYRYTGKGTLVPLNLTRRKTPLITTRLKFAKIGAVTGRLELDTGADNAFKLNEPFVRKHRLLRSSRKLAEQARHGAGGDERDLLGQARTAAFGSIIFRNVPVGFSMGTTGASAATDNDGVIGGEVLRRFKLIIDYSRRRLILEPNGSLNDAFDVEGE